MDTLTLVATAIGIIAAILGGVWFILQHAFKLGEMSNRFSVMEEKLNSIPCAEHQQTLDTHTRKAEATGQAITAIRQQVSTLPCRKHHEALTEHTRQMDTVSEKLRNTGSIVTELSKWVMKIDETMIDRLMQKCSPMRMTPAGEQLFTMSHADRALDILAPRLMQQMSEAELRTEYDVEAKALETLLQNTSDPAFDQVKNFVYAAPDTFTPEGDGDPIKFTFYSIVHLMGIRLRDMYLEQHPVASPAIYAAE